jgi:NitT/TauT family transport system permease protein
MRQRMRRLASLPGVPPLLACIVLLGAWQGLARILAVDGLPPPGQALRALPALLGDREALLNIADSLRRMLIGFGLGLAFAVPVGLVMGRSRLAAASLGPLLGIVYPIPKAALMPIIMLWLGIGDASKLLVIFLGVSLPVIYHSQQGARAVEEKMLWSAAAMGMSAGRQLIRIVLPAALPEVFTGARTGLVLALITMVTSEMIARQAGIGNILFNALDMAQYETVYASILVIAVLGFALDWACERLRRWALAWAEPTLEKALPALAVGST